MIVDYKTTTGSIYRVDHANQRVKQLGMDEDWRDVTYVRADGTLVFFETLIEAEDEDGTPVVLQTRTTPIVRFRDVVEN